MENHSADPAHGCVTVNKRSAAILAKDRPRVRVRLLDGRAGEADERRIGQGQFKLCEGCEYFRCFPE